MGFQHLQRWTPRYCRYLILGRTQSHERGCSLVALKTWPLKKPPRDYVGENDHLMSSTLDQEIEPLGLVSIEWQRPLYR